MVPPALANCFNNIFYYLVTIFFVLLLSSPKWNVEAIYQPLLYGGVTSGCRTIISILETLESNKLTVNGDTDISVVCSGPGGKENISLPVNKTAADQLVNLKILNPEATTIVTIHGYNDNLGSPTPLGIANGYFALGLHNVLQIDSSKLTTYDFFKAVRSSWLIGDVVAKFLADLCSMGVLKPPKIHILGLSLGGHTAASVGRMFKKYTGQKIGRITGIEQPMLCFEYNERQLTKEDAEYVDVIHSNRGLEGIYEPTGHADYFINGGGPNQPGCPDVICNHYRAGFLYIESLNPKYEPFYSRKCDTFFDFLGGLCDYNDIAIMGYNSSTTTKGLYFLRTINEPPYSMGIGGAKNDDQKLFYEVLGRLGLDSLF